MKKEVIEFIRTKDYKFVKEIGQGGTGRTVLIEDPIINESFICKKYSPFHENHKETYFKNFVQEIRLLHVLYHRNVVRVFNYYLYPEKTTGYILMEFVDGLNIKEYIENNPDKLNNIFIQVVNAFSHLEENNILHRDIRPENIMVSNQGVVKIIDFGFGKSIDFNEDFDNSVSLNWRYSIPNDFKSKTYDFKTEIYFVGKLFEEIIQENDLQNLIPEGILQDMTTSDPLKRISSFFEVERKILANDTDTLNFTNQDKIYYKQFADNLISIFTKLEDDIEYLRDIERIKVALEAVYKDSILEEFVQNPSTLTRCFVIGNYYYNKASRFPVLYLKHFLQLLKKVSIDKRKVILNNLWQRIDTIDRYIESNSDDDDDLPF